MSLQGTINYYLENVCIDCEHYDSENDCCDAVKHYDVNMFEITNGWQFGDVCERIFEQMEYDDTIRCIISGEYCLSENTVWLSDLQEYVSDCDDYHYCYNCDCYVSNENWDDEYDCCSECAERYYSDLIGQWHDGKGEWNYYGDSDKRIGFELEIDKGNNHGECAQELSNYFGRHLYYEWDCSLDDGFEIISMPHDETTMNKLNIEKLCNIALKYGYRSHDTNTCGLHLHFSKEWLSNDVDEQDERLYKILAFYHRNFETMVKLSRRTNWNKINQYCADDDLTSMLYEYETQNAVVHYKKRGFRYRAVNLENWDRYGTIEFRLGRGTLNADTIRAWIDIHARILENSKTAKTYSLAEWLIGVKAETLEYIASKDVIL